MYVYEVISLNSS